MYKFKHTLNLKKPSVTVKNALENVCRNFRFRSSQKALGRFSTTLGEVPISGISNYTILVCYDTFNDGDHASLLL